MNTFVVKSKHRAWLFIEMTARTAGVILLFVFFCEYLVFADDGLRVCGVTE